MTSPKKQFTEAAVREIRRRTRRKFSPEEKIRIVLEGLRGEESVSELRIVNSSSVFSCRCKVEMSGSPQVRNVRLRSG